MPNDILIALDCFIIRATGPRCSHVDVEYSVKSMPNGPSGVKSSLSVVHLLMISRVGRIIRNHGLDTISSCNENGSSVIGRKPFLLNCIELGKVMYVFVNNEVPPEGPQSKGNRFLLGAEIVLTILLLSQKKANGNTLSAAVNTISGDPISHPFSCAFGSAKTDRTLISHVGLLVLRYLEFQLWIRHQSQYPLMRRAQTMILLFPIPRKAQLAARRMQPRGISRHARTSNTVIPGGRLRLLQFQLELTPEFLI